MKTYYVERDMLKVIGISAIIIVGILLLVAAWSVVHRKAAELKAVKVDLEIAMTVITAHKTLLRAQRIEDELIEAKIVELKAQVLTLKTQIIEGKTNVANEALSLAMEALHNNPECFKEMQKRRTE